MVFSSFIRRTGIKSVIALALIMGGAGHAAYSAPSACPEHFHAGQLPDFTNERLTLSAKELCSPGHSVWYSGVARAPLFSASYLTKGRLAQAANVDRSNNFREDRRIPSDWRAKLSDFRGSGFDRGHLAPSADMHTPIADSESFYLTNIVAQDPQLNRNLWASIERAVRSHAKHRSVYVITGVLYLEPKVQRLNGRVMIPSHLYKLVYEPQRQMGAAYLVENLPNRRHKEVTLAELETLAGIRFLPQVASESVRPLKLPRPRYNR